MPVAGPAVTPTIHQRCAHCGVELQLVAHIPRVAPSREAASALLRAAAALLRSDQRIRGRPRRRSALPRSTGAHLADTSQSAPRAIVDSPIIIPASHSSARPRRSAHPQRASKRYGSTRACRCATASTRPPSGELSSASARVFEQPARRCSVSVVSRHRVIFILPIPATASMTSPLIGQDRRRLRICLESESRP